MENEDLACSRCGGYNYNRDKKCKKYVDLSKILKGYGEEK